MKNDLLMKELIPIPKDILYTIESITFIGRLMALICEVIIVHQTRFSFRSL